LVILDLAMPDVDGFQVLDAIRAHPRIRSVPVVVLSGQRLNDADLRRLDQQRLTFQSKGIWRDSEFANEIERAVSASERPAAQTGSLVRLAVAFMQQHYTRPLNRSEIAAAVGVHKDYLSQIFRQELGITAWDYLNRYRIERAKELLCGSTTSITSIATHVGFEDVSYFGRVFRREVGCSAATYREQATEYQP
jgi:YesN/AraC family two-component response regulator